jgi:hypothetical protein
MRADKRRKQSAVNSAAKQRDEARRGKMTTPEREERVREIAHKIWQEVGQPSDQAKLHWEMAEKELEEAEGATKPANRRSTKDDKPPFLKSEPLV